MPDRLGSALPRPPDRRAGDRPDGSGGRTAGGAGAACECLTGRGIAGGPPEQQLPQKAVATGMFGSARSDMAPPVIVSATATAPRSRLVAARVRMASFPCGGCRPAHPRRPGGGDVRGDGGNPPSGRPVRPWRCRESRTAVGPVPDADRATAGQRRPSMTRQAELDHGVYRPAPEPGAVRSAWSRRDRDRSLRVAQPERPDGEPVIVERPKPESQRRVAVEQIADEPHSAANQTN